MRSSAERKLLETTRYRLLDPEIGESSIFFVALDVTERERDAEELRQKRDRLLSIYDNSPFMLLARDRSGKFLEMSSAADSNFDIDRENAIGLSLHDIYDKDSVEMTVRLDKAFLDSGEAEMTDTFDLRTKAGKDIRLRITRHRMPDNPDAVFGFAVDMTNVD